MMLKISRRKLQDYGSEISESACGSGGNDRCTESEITIGIRLCQCRDQCTVSILQSAEINRDIIIFKVNKTMENKEQNTQNTASAPVQTSAAAKKKENKK